MHALPLHPFSLLVSPETVSKAVADSERLAHLRRRICRPLDKPTIPLRPQPSAPGA